MATITIDLSGKNGLAKNFASGFASTSAQPNLVYEAADGQVAGGTYNPFRQPGYLNPANNTFEAVTFADGTAGLIRSFVYDAINGDTYAAENGAQMWGLSTPNDTSFQLFNTLASITITDLEIYMVNGVRKLFYAYQKSGGGNIGMYDLPATTNDATWLSATCAGGYTLSADGDIFMLPADNGRMYVFDKYEIHEINGTASGGTNGTVQRMVAFPTYFVCTDALDYRGNLWVSIQSAPTVGNSDSVGFAQQVCGVYIWDRQSTEVRMRDFIPVKGVKEIKKIYLGADNKITINCITSELKVVIKKFNGTSFDTIHELGRTAFPRYRDSVANFPDYTMWLGQDGILYANGIAPTSTKDSLFKLGDLLTLHATPTTGAIVPVFPGGGSSTDVVNMSGIILSYTGATSLLKRWAVNGTGSTVPVGSYTVYPHTGSVYSPVKIMPLMSTVEKIYVYMAPITSTGTTVQGSISIYFNQSTTAWATKNITRTDISKGYIVFEVNKAYINAVQFKTTYPTDVAISASFNFAPYLAVVNYQPTNTLK